MENEMNLTNGVKIEVGEHGVNAIGTDGEVIRFDDNGRQLHESVFNRAEIFMEHFDFMGHEQQKIAKEWYAVYKEEKIKKYVEYRRVPKIFFGLLDLAVENVTEEYFIANLEPSIDQNGRIYYKVGEKVTRGFSPNKWRQKAREFAPECESDLATAYQLVLWYAYRIAMGYWTVEYVCENSYSEGNYWNSPDATHKIEVSGTKKVGGAYDGVGNTRKLVLYRTAFFALFGGCYGEFGNEHPVGEWESIVRSDNTLINSTGVVALNKVRSTEC